MTTGKQDGLDQLNALNTTLGNVENELLHRAVARREAENSAILQTVRDLEKEGVVEICPCDGDEESSEG